MPKPSKQVIIDAIIKEIEQGKTYTKVMAVNGRKWQMPERTFNRYWKTANEQHIVKQQAIKKELAEVDKQAAIEARKKAIMTADERKEWLSSLITKKTKIMKVGGTTQMVYEYLDENGKPQSEILNTELKLKALAELNKMEGDYAPTKLEHSGETLITWKEERIYEVNKKANDSA